MANRSYLIITDRSDLLPSVQMSESFPDSQIVAEGTYCIPLLWICLFRPANLVSAAHKPGAATDDIPEPVAALDSALNQLAAAVPIIERMFPQNGSLTEHAHLLGQVLKGGNSSFVGVAWAEIADMLDRETFRSHSHYALSALAGDVPLAVGRKSLFQLSQVDPAVPFPPVAMGQGTESLTPLLGTSWVQAVPWESA